jgi:hypothetical protein
MGGRLSPRVTRPCDSAERRASATLGPRLHFLFSRGPYSRRSRQGHAESPPDPKQAMSRSDGAFESAFGRSPSSLFLAASCVAFGQILFALVRSSSAASEGKPPLEPEGSLANPRSLQSFGETPTRSHSLRVPSRCPANR